jgi:hypothetical protein
MNTKPSVRFRPAIHSVMEVYCRDCDYQWADWKADFLPDREDYCSWPEYENRKLAKGMARRHAYATGHVVKVARVRYYRLAWQPDAPELVLDVS